MPELFTLSSRLPLVLLWMVVALATMAAAAGSAWLAATGRREPTWWPTLVRGALVTVMAVALADLVPRLTAPAERDGPWVFVRVASGLVGMLLGAVILAMPPRSIGRWGWLTTVAMLASLVVSYVRFTAVAAPEHFDASAATIAPSEPEDDETGARAITDRGSIIRLRRYVTVEHDPLPPEGFGGRVIVAGSGDSPANCHGWVFTGGRFQVAGNDVAQILDENGYRAVSTPQAQDLIVYRAADGTIVHTGLVKATGPDGFVLVESKWGPLDIYWHTPHDQAYSQRFEYWRSPRDGHLLTIETPRR